MTRGVVTEEGGRQNIYAIEPTVYVAQDSGMGFTKRAETLNGRLAMIGFVSAILLEVITGHGVLGFLANLSNVQ
ncbi:MAG: chlorophyll a/b-binding protein [Cyanobacteria bacterium]|nr:chlorophyll a/b-binding protein [Cyanobacteriota bacterium]MDW8201226.1 chlorophyll a/b-binding protein [Cyanobacteriota bacterium SKYGB_h_bin112]